MTKESESLFAGSFVFYLYAACRALIPLSNIMFYVAGCVLFCGTTLVAYLLIKEKKVHNGLIPAILIIVWMIIGYIFEFDETFALPEKDYLRRTIPLYFWIPLMAAGTVLILFLLKKEKEHTHKKLQTILRAAISILFGIGVSVQTYAPNIFQDVQGGTYHSHAYNNSILQVCWMIPYSKNMETLYGHHALFYLPFLKLMHHFFALDYLTGIFLFNAIVEFISILLFAAILNRIIKKDVIFYMALFSIGEYYFMLTRGGIYLQVHAHRLIFPMITAYIVLRETSEKKKAEDTGKELRIRKILYEIFIVFILTCSITWSTEVGFTTMAAYALYRCFLKITTDDTLTDKIISCARYFIRYILVPFFASYLIVLLYNRLCHAPLSIREYLFPIISDRDYVENTELALPGPAHAWVFSSILLLCYVMVPVICYLCKKETPEKETIRNFGFGIMALGLLLYYIHRPTAGGISILVFLGPILMAELLEKLTEKGSKDHLSLILKIAMSFVFFMMAFDSLVSMPGAWKISKETIWKRDELLEFSEHIYNQVPPFAYSFGEGVPEIMSLLDRDTYLHTTEWSVNNMPLDTMEYARKELEGRDFLFCNLYSLSILQENYPGLTDEYDLHETFEYNGAEFGLFYHK